MSILIQLAVSLSDPGLSAGAIAGIVIGSVFGFLLLLLLLILLILCCLRRKKQREYISTVLQDVLERIGVPVAYPVNVIPCGVWSESCNQELPGLNPG